MAIKLLYESSLNVVELSVLNKLLSLIDNNVGVLWKADGRDTFNLIIKS